ncbi:MAG: tRNA (N6-isopentenyl adenosine(37)-C2)-methylthiotransferase MiaB [Clostridiales bacterium]|nr:tRNA (N6-isopentenyl adenosine(37)-C2)-methylthiotransferase MiaB [Clostridiales bacterium]
MSDSHIKLVRAINDDYSAKTGFKRRAFIKTYGCQMNAHDSAKLESMLSDMGYERSEDEKNADLVIYNTCCVRERAEEKVFGKLGLLKAYKSNKPDMMIALCGCMVQQNAILDKTLKIHKHIDIIFGTFNIRRFPQLLFSRIETGGRVVDVWDEHDEIDEPVILNASFKASVNIMYGCDNFCSYCIVPYVRGHERSRRADDILDETRKLAANGAKEISLLGQNVNSYRSGDTNFAALIRMINDVDGVERIRFITSHPKDLSDELIEAMRDCKKVCRHIHLPAQSGSDKVLRDMRRGYTRERYLGLLAKLRAAMPDIDVTTDIIVGFPGETERDFQDTLNLVEEARYSGAFTFIYSKRAGTPAANMPNQIDEKTAKDRFNRLLAAIYPIALELNQRSLGRALMVLAEGKGANGLLTGRSEGNMTVHIDADERYIGSIIPVKITACKTFYLVGEIA